MREPTQRTLIRSLTVSLTLMQTGRCASDSPFGSLTSFSRSWTCVRAIQVTRQFRAASQPSVYHLGSDARRERSAMYADQLNEGLVAL